VAVVEQSEPTEGCESGGSLRSTPATLVVPSYQLVFSRTLSVWFRGTGSRQDFRYCGDPETLGEFRYDSNSSSNPQAVKMQLIAASIVAALDSVFEEM
jgi:hypothetical protein